MGIQEYFDKKAEQKHKLNELKQNCFNARQALIVTSNDKSSGLSGCIQITYSIENRLPDAWRVGMVPEDGYRVTGPDVNYCFSFEAKNPLRRKCICKLCPMYKKYMKYLEAYEALQAEKNKTK